LELYGHSESTDMTSQGFSFSLSVCDSLLNIGPITDLAIGDPSFLSVHFYFYFFLFFYIFNHYFIQ